MHRKYPSLKLINGNGDKFDKKSPLTKEVTFDIFVCHRSNLNRGDHDNSDISSGTILDDFKNFSLGRRQKSKILE